MTPAQRTARQLYRKHWPAIQAAAKAKHRYYETVSENYRELRKLRTTIQNYRISITEHQAVIDKFCRRMAQALRRKKVLELAWAYERTQLKQSGKWKRFSKYDYMNGSFSDTHVRE